MHHSFFIIWSQGSVITWSFSSFLIGNITITTYSLISHWPIWHHFVQELGWISAIKKTLIYIFKTQKIEPRIPQAWAAQPGPNGRLSFYHMYLQNFVIHLLMLAVSPYWVKFCLVSVKQWTLVYKNVIYMKLIIRLFDTVVLMLDNFEKEVLGIPYSREH